MILKENESVQSKKYDTAVSFMDYPRRGTSPAIRLKLKYFTHKLAGIDK